MCRKGGISYQVPCTVKTRQWLRGGGGGARSRFWPSLAGIGSPIIRTLVLLSVCLWWQNSNIPILKRYWLNFARCVSVNTSNCWYSWDESSSIGDTIWFIQRILAVRSIEGVRISLTQFSLNLLSKPNFSEAPNHFIADSSRAAINCTSPCLLCSENYADDFHAINCTWQSFVPVLLINTGDFVFAIYCSLSCYLYT